jgi:hypothetical protein
MTPTAVVGLHPASPTARAWNTVWIVGFAATLQRPPLRVVVSAIRIHAPPYGWAQTSTRRAARPLVIRPLTVTRCP